MFNLASDTPPFDDLYPERPEYREDEWLDRIGSNFVNRLARRRLARKRRVESFLAAVEEYEPLLSTLDDAALLEQCRHLSLRLRRDGLTDHLVAESFALTREVAERKVGLRHFRVQLIGGWIMLNGMIAEMETGEGKTLTATLAAGAAALAGMPVHIVTVNDYLASRDYTQMQPLFTAIGLSTAVVTETMRFDERQAAYRADVVYCTNKTLVFDYLRDRIVLGSDATNLLLRLEVLYGRQSRNSKLLLRGLHFAIVDEADSVLVDEARTPLIISASVPLSNDLDTYHNTLAQAQELEVGLDFIIMSRERRVALTKTGLDRLSELEWGDSLRSNPARQEEIVLQALSALHLFLRDDHYLVRDGKVQVIDEHTGRVMADRTWSQGLHQMIEIKEGCEMTSRRETMARISYQRFFMRYLRLGGMTGTAAEVARELGVVYGLAVVKIPTNRVSQRIERPVQVFAKAEEKWQAIALRVEELHRTGIPVLLGTRSVAASEEAAARLAARGLIFCVLSAKQDKEEAEIIAAAGWPGRITIATNMAGRGTDIQLSNEVVLRGGLHVILSDRHEARRIDRQLAGRCARQGDPGCFETILSLDDVILEPFRGGWQGLLMRSAMRLLPFIKPWLMRAWIGYAQRRTEQLQFRIRKALLKSDRQMGDILAFSGRSE